MLSTPPQPSSARAEKLALGAGSLAAFIGYTGIATLAIPVYQMTLGVNQVTLSIALAAPRLWEAFADPVMGNITDNFRSRWGRRRPFIAVGAVAMGVLYALIWMVSPGWSEPAKLAYFTLTSVLFYTAYTVFSVPYSSLTYEMTPDYHERTRVMACCSYFSKAGEFVYQWIYPASQLAIFATALIGIRCVGWMVGLGLLTGVGLLPAIFVRERFRETAVRRPRVEFWRTIGDSFRSRPFVIVMGLVLLNIVMGMLASNVDHYVLVYYMYGGDIAVGSAWKAVLSSAYAIIGIAAIPAVVWLSRRIGKRQALIAIYALTSVGGAAKWFAFNPRHPWLILLDPLLCGPIWVAANVLLASMLADVCDEDELKSGQRREGMFGAMYSWVQKTAVSLSFLAAGVALTASGFDATLRGAQSLHTFTSMRLLLCASTIVPPIVAIALLRIYPLDAAHAAETQRQLQARKGNVTGLDAAPADS